MISFISYDIYLYITDTATAYRHLVPSWQSAERHRKLKIMMQDRPVGQAGARPGRGGRARSAETGGRGRCSRSWWTVLHAPCIVSPRRAQARALTRKAKCFWQDLIQSELAGLAFDSLQQVFRKGDIALAFDTAGLPYEEKQTIWMVVDPAAGGPQSDYAVVSIVRTKGCVQVC